MKLSKRLSTASSRLCASRLPAVALAAAAWGVGVGSAHAVDVKAYSIKAPSATTVGQQAVFEYTVVKSDISSPYSLKIVASKDATISSDDLVLFHAPQQSSTGSAIGFTMPKVKPGTYFVGLWVGAKGDNNPADDKLLGNLFTILSAEPDLIAASINGPTTAKAEGGFPPKITFWITNSGAVLQDPYGYQIRLSKDTVITAQDPIIHDGEGTVHTIQAIDVSIPVTLASGTYYWGLTIDKAKGELDLSDNAKAGGQVVVQGALPKVCLQNAGPKTICTLPGVSPAPVSIGVRHCGTQETVLNWKVSGDQAAWIDASPDYGSIIGGTGVQDPVTISFSTAGLAPGDHHATIRVYDYANPLDFQDVSITVCVGTPEFRPGDVLNGQLSGPGDEREVRFHALPGMKLKLQVSALGAGQQLRIRIDSALGHGGEVVMKKAKQKKTFKFVAEEELVLKIGSVTGAGAFSIATSGKYKGNLLGFKKKLGNKASPDAALLLHALEGSVLMVTAQTTKKYGGTGVLLRLIDPDQIEVDISGYQSAMGSHGQKIAPFELGKSGTWRLEAHGVVGKKSVKTKIGIDPYAGSAVIQL